MKNQKHKKNKNKNKNKHKHEQVNNNIYMNKNVQVATIIGKVYDLILDCGHLTISGTDGELLHDLLREFEGKKVKVTIKIIDE